MLGDCVQEFCWKNDCQSYEWKRQAFNRQKVWLSMMLQVEKNCHWFMWSFYLEDIEKLTNNGSWRKRRQMVMWWSPMLFLNTTYLYLDLQALTMKLVVIHITSCDYDKIFIIISKGMQNQIFFSVCCPSVMPLKVIFRL